MFLIQSSEHELNVVDVDGRRLFKEKKEKWLSKRDMVHVMVHTQEINDKFITIEQKVDKHGHQLTDIGYIKWTSKDLDIEQFKIEWESVWKSANPLDFSFI